MDQADRIRRQWRLSLVATLAAAFAMFGSFVIAVAYWLTLFD
jgi:hypothetical protein